MNNGLQVKEQQSLIGKILENKIQTNKKVTSKFFNENIKNKSREEICKNLEKYHDLAELLLEEETKDDGGIAAITGFYFQFLVSIKYLVDLINGEWDYLLIDHHQDIIVINPEKVRVIQAKTKNVPYVDVSKIDLYRDWIQKLFAVDEILQGYEQKREFELVTNFIIKNSRDVEGVEVYRGNDSFDMPIQKNTFFDRVKDYSEKGGYTNLLDENYLQDLLSRFKITDKPTEEFIYEIYSMVGSLFSERTKAIKKDIDYIIGHICSLCYYPEDPSIQLIDREKGLQIIENLQPEILNDHRQYVNKEDSVEKINWYIENLHNIFKSSSLYTDLCQYIQEFEQELKENINDDNNIFNIMSRFVDRVFSSYKFSNTKKDTIDQYIKELFDLTFLLKLSTGGKVTIDFKNRKLLLKIIGDNKYSFFNLKDTDDYISGEEKFKDVFKGLNFEEQRMLIDEKTFRIIFSGNFDDDDFPDEYYIDLDFADNPTEEDMEYIGVKVDKDSMSIVTYKVPIKNGSNYVKDRIFGKRVKLSLEEYKQEIKVKLG